MSVPPFPYFLVNSFRIRSNLELPISTLSFHKKDMPATLVSSFLPATTLHEAPDRRFLHTRPARPRLPSSDQKRRGVLYGRCRRSSSQRKSSLRKAVWLVPIWRSFL